jgi:tRNA A37 methylthiotransferase MiaB
MKKQLWFVLPDSTIEYSLPMPYLVQYAAQDTSIAEHWEFIPYKNIAFETTIDDLLRSNADVYAFSCYVWNTGLVKRTVQKLLEHKPDANIILGGPQVSWQGAKYLSAKHENLVLCNGEGENIFRDYLKELMRPMPNYANVKGLSFYQQGILLTNPSADLIKSLDEIPSPFDCELFEVANSNSIVYIETVRSCPFTCTYCSSGIERKKLRRLSKERIESDILKIVKKGVKIISFCDDNFGLFEQDVETAKFIAHCKEKYGVPNLIYKATTKQNMHRTAEIEDVLHQAGISSPVEVPLQTLNDAAVANISRKHDVDAYMWLIDFLNKKGIDSYLEYIWPLPGETLPAFKQAIAKLCRTNANVIFVYPFSLLHNTQMQYDRIKFGLETICSDNPDDEVEYVIKTRDVSYGENLEGWHFIMAQTVLYGMRSLFVTARYLDTHNIADYQSLFENFVKFTLLKLETSDFPFYQYMQSGCFKSDKELNTITYELLYSRRDDYDAMLFEFASSQSWWRDETARILFEVDLVNREYMYSGTVTPKHYPFEYLEILDTTTDRYLLKLPLSVAEEVKTALGVKASFNSEYVEVSHKQKQEALDKTMLEEERIMRSFHIFMTPYAYLPEWRDYTASAVSLKKVA